MHVHLRNRRRNLCIVKSEIQKVGMNIWFVGEAYRNDKRPVRLFRKNGHYCEEQVFHY